jgi:hypothetical protein
MGRQALASTAWESLGLRLIPISARCLNAEKKNGVRKIIDYAFFKRGLTPTDFQQVRAIMSGVPLRESEMSNPEIVYHGHALIPSAAFDEGLYAAMLVVRGRDGVQRASGVLGHFPCKAEACRFAIEYGMAEIDKRPVPEPEWA